MIKGIILVCFLAACNTPSHVSPKNETVHLQIAPKTSVCFEAKSITHEPKKHASGLCIYKGQLYTSALTSPPYKVLVSGSITISGKSIPLDISGLANPWIDPSDMSQGSCRLKRHEFGEDNKEISYTLDVAFLKGGAEDYIVTWDIYQGHSLRTKIEGVGDVLPEWIK